MRLQVWLALWLALGGLWSVPAAAQLQRVQSITATDLGKVAASAAGTTDMRIDPATGAVTVVAGSGAQIGVATMRSLVTIDCNQAAGCVTKNPNITITATGSPTGRAGALKNFTISTAGATGTIVTPPGTGDSINFTLDPTGRTGTRSFYVGFDMPILGDSSGGPTGLSTAQFVVTAYQPGAASASTLAGTASITVNRSLAVSRSTNLSFGRIFRPSSGTGTVELDQATGAVTVTGAGAFALPSPAPSAASFNVSGEGGQSVSVTVPASVTLTSPSGSLVVATTTNAAGAQILSGSAGSAGSLAVRVGGSLPISSSTPIGNYTGTFAVTVQYN